MPSIGLSVAPGAVDARLILHRVSRRLSDEQRQASAIRGALRAIARGERPLCSVRHREDGTWSVYGMPWLVLTATTPEGAVGEARAAVSALLEVDPDRLDVRVE